MSSKSRRVLRRTAIALLAVIMTIAVVGGGFVIMQLNEPLPNHGGEHIIPGADAAIEINRDDNGVPNIYASTDEDLFRAQGYVHAQDRFFEMDYRRHMTGGRLSELVGNAEAAKQADVVIRSMGWRRIAEQEWDLISEESRQFYTAYADGVNAYIAGREPSGLALEYTVLSLSHPIAEVEPWTGIDSLAWLKAMAWDLKNNLDDETARVVAHASLGDTKLVDELYPAFSTTGHDPIIPTPADSDISRRDDYPRTEPLPVPSLTPGTGTPQEPATTEDSAEASAETQISDMVVSAQETMDAMPVMLGSGSGVGSNSFIIGGDYTESGMPILANDPHLTISYPSVWYQVGLHCEQITPDCTYDASGFSFAGMPGLIIGRNSDLAWGLTNLGGDVTDFVIEKNTGDTTYERDGSSVEYEIWNETFHVAGEDSYEVEIRQSVHGPIISDLLLSDPVAGELPGVPDEFSVALEWTALKPGLTGDAIFAINRARNAADVADAGATFEVPAQNIVFATVDGDYGYQAPGRFPVRPEISEADGDMSEGQLPENLGADGRWPRPGWDSRYDWQGYYAPEDMPSLVNPSEGFIVAANQQVTDSRNGPYLGSYADGGYRSQSIRDALEAKIEQNVPLTLDDVEELMLLDQSPFGLELAEQFVSVAAPDDRIGDIQDILEDWLARGAHAGVDDGGAAIMASAYSHLLDLTLGQRIEDFAAENSTNYLLFFANLGPDSEWWDNPGTDEVEDRDAAMLAALEAMDRDLSEQMGEDPSLWRWGDVHVETPTHSVLGGEDIPGIVRSYFNGEPREVPGGSAIPNAMAYSPEVDDQGFVDYEVTAGPSMRMAVDMIDTDEATWIISSGTSGHPRSAQVDDQFSAWTTGDSLPWAFSRDAVVKNERDFMTISGK